VSEQYETVAIGQHTYAGDNNDFYPKIPRFRWQFPTAILPPASLIGGWLLCLAGGLTTAVPPGGNKHRLSGSERGSSASFNSNLFAWSIGSYAKAAGVYHCPADKYMDPQYKVTRVVHAR